MCEWGRVSAGPEAVCVNCGRWRGQGGAAEPPGRWVGKEGRGLFERGAGRLDAWSGGRESGRRAGGGAAPAWAAGWEGAGRASREAWSRAWLDFDSSTFWARGRGLHVLPPVRKRSFPRVTLPPGVGGKGVPAPAWGRGPSHSAHHLLLPSPPRLRSVRGGGCVWGVVSIFFALRRPPSHSVSPPLAPVTWAGSLLPRPRATSLLHPPGSLSGEVGRGSPGTPPTPLVEGRGGRRGVRFCRLEPNVGAPANLPGILLTRVIVVFNWVSFVCLILSS